jgi:hypothetical protein
MPKRKNRWQTHLKEKIMIRICLCISVAIGCRIIEDYFKINPCGLGLFLILFPFIPNSKEK